MRPKKHVPRSLAVLQAEHRDWVLHNFPDQDKMQNRHQPFLGMVEEVGELAHAMLKYEQGIREVGTAIQLHEALSDGIGDFVIFLAGFCDVHHISLEDAVFETWDRVKKRDWILNPQTGEAS